MSNLFTLILHITWFNQLENENPEIFHANLFYLLLFILAGLIIFGWFQIRLRMSKKRQRILQGIIKRKTDELRKEKLELIKQNRKIEQQNKEKDILIQEIHHRVKNNLQSITSLIYMQMANSRTNEAKNALEDIYRRTSAMSMVHQMLHTTDNSSSISARSYLKEMVEFINDMVNDKSLPIKFKTRACVMDLSISDGIAFGMITSEAISNSIKHAFNGVENPEITVDLFHNKDHSKLIYKISDNGNGLPGEFERNPQTSMGMRLIQIFTNQLKGAFTIQNINGTSLNIEIPLQ